MYVLCWWQPGSLQVAVSQRGEPDAIKLNRTGQMDVQEGCSFSFLVCPHLFSLQGVSCDSCLCTCAGGHISGVTTKTKGDHHSDEPTKSLPIVIFLFNS